MKKTNKRLAAVALSTALFVGGFAALNQNAVLAATSARDEVKLAEKAVEAAKEKVKKLEEGIKKAKDDFKEYNKQALSWKNVRRKSTATVDEFKEKVADLEKKDKDLDAKIAGLKDKLSTYANDIGMKPVADKIKAEIAEVEKEKEANAKQINAQKAGLAVAENYYNNAVAKEKEALANKQKAFDTKNKLQEELAFPKKDKADAPKVDDKKADDKKADDKKADDKKADDKKADDKKADDKKADDKKADAKKADAKKADDKKVVVKKNNKLPKTFDNGIVQMAAAALASVGGSVLLKKKRK